MSKVSKIIAILVLLLTPLYASQFSPGDLHESHAQLEGLGNCLKCHEVGKKVSNGKCLDCHTTLQKEIRNNKGLHARSDYKNCLTCHKEHIGKTADLIRWEGGRDHFNHEKTGYILEGKHRQVTCEKCHTTKQMSNKKTSYLGLSADCLSCHKDEHKKQFSSKCLSCHKMDSWKSIETFDHNKARYKLTGKHTNLQCDKCHKRNPPKTGPIQFKNIPFASCSQCHTDPHKGKLGATCEKCHVTEAWKTMTNKTSFNHDLTAYPLRGKHVAVDCKKCHNTSKKKKPLAYKKCEDCHENPHKNVVKLKSCESCHSVNRFTPSDYTIASHNAQTYLKLSGAHLAVSCKACHIRPASKLWDFRLKETRCTDCHINKHKGLFSAANENKVCEDCHNDRSWAPTKFNHDRDSRYVLDGKHYKLACQTCHQTKNMAGEKTLIYRPLPLNCQGCHSDK